MQQRRHLLAAACASVAGSTIALPSWAQSNYPTRDISGIIQWGAGGGTDVAVRGYTPYAEEVLGRKILMSNRTGGAGAIGANFVLDWLALHDEPVINLDKLTYAGNLEIGRAHV